ncbi:MAG: hypothetical protein CR984_03070 [Proteobacteria bacterium]|nr:MAG: hypothetical protein CR984_03070 [Pseudomonadota bacterium]PIE66724.1 MAG: hypothetical protein CSA23_07655 [Deltaproteobacteria bacterium]
MYKRALRNVLIILMLSFMPCFAGAATVTLDAVDNSGWWVKDLNEPYLNILNDGGEVAWSLETESLGWNNFGELVADLSDLYIGDPDNGIRLGSTYVIESGGNAFSTGPQEPIYETVSLAAGNYAISLTQDSDTYNIMGYEDENYSSEDRWNAYVQMWTSDGQTLSFGDGGTYFGSSGAALDAHETLSISLYLPVDADLNLYINDINALDNIGSVSLRIQSTPVPAAWVLLGSGIAAFIGGRRCRRKKTQ